MCHETLQGSNHRVVTGTQHISIFKSLRRFRQSQNGIHGVTEREGGGGGQDISQRLGRGVGEGIPVLLQSLDGLCPVDLRLLHDELDVILAHIWKGEARVSNEGGGASGSCVIE